MPELHHRSLVDIHSHLYLSWYLDLLRARSEVPYVDVTSAGERLIVIPETQGVPLTSDFWSVEEKLRFMNQRNIEVSLVSPGNPWLTFREDSASSLELADRTNDDFATLAESSAGRLQSLGLLPMSSVADCVRSVDTAAARNVLLGFITGPEICGLPFDDPALGSLWATLDREGSILLLHPGVGWLTSVEDGMGLTIGVSFPVETTVAAARLLLAAVPQHFPGIRFVLAHGGGALPFLLGRFDQTWGRGRSDHLLPSRMAQRFYADALLYSAESLAFAASVLGQDRLMWGSDHPFPVPDPLEQERWELKKPDLEPIARETARSLMGL